MFWLTTLHRPDGQSQAGVLWLAPLLIIGLLAISACADGASRIRPGMGEDEVKKILGAPSRSTSDRQDIKFYVGENAKCAKLAAKVLVLERRFREDVMVGLGSDGKVLCVERAELFTH